MLQSMRPLLAGFYAHLHLEAGLTESDLYCLPDCQPAATGSWVVFSGGLTEQKSLMGMKSTSQYLAGRCLAAAGFCGTRQHLAGGCPAAASTHRLLADLVLPHAVLTFPHLLSLPPRPRCCHLGPQRKGGMEGRGAGLPRACPPGEAHTDGARRRPAAAVWR